MISLTINTSGKIPVYKQLVRQFETAMRTGKLKDGEQVTSMNNLSASLGISKETVKKVYSVLRDKGLLEARQGKGFYVSIPAGGVKPSVLVIFDKLSAYKQTLFDAFASVIGDKAEVTILLHNQNVDLLEYYVDEYVGKYDYYVITPHFALDDPTQRRVARIIARIPNRQLIMADHWMKSVKGNYGVVYQDFASDAPRGLASAVRKIARRGILHVITLENSLYGGLIEKVIGSYCRKYGIDTRFHKKITPAMMVKGAVYLMLNSSLDDGLITLARMAREKRMKIGRDIGIISYNESPMSEIVLGGLTTISTDFAQMGRLVARMILDRKMEKIRCDFKMTRRASF